MSLTRIALANTLTTNSTCTDITLTDTTGLYPTATYGYGVPSGASVNSVTQLIMTVNLAGGIFFTYTFTIASGSISAATLSISGTTAVNIITLLPSLVFPLTNFSLFNGYGVTLPSFADGIYDVDYTISGSAVGSLGESESFSYTTSNSLMISCNLCCCLQKMGLSIDPDCDCSAEKENNYLRANMYLDVARFNANIGKNDAAQSALDKATELCNCSGCGC